MTYLYHRWEQAFGKDGLDLSLWIMILLILHNSITSWAGAAKTAAHQATTVTLQVSSKEQLKNSQRWQVWREVSWPYLCYTWDPSTGPAGLKPWPCPDALWASMGTAAPWPRWHWHIWASAQSLRLSAAGCFSWARPRVCWVWSSLYFIKAALGHSPVIVRVFQMPGWKQTPIKTEWLCQVQKVK